MYVQEVHGKNVNQKFARKLKLGNSRVMQKLAFWNNQPNFQPLYSPDLKELNLKFIVFDNSTRTLSLHH